MSGCHFGRSGDEEKRTSLPSTKAPTKTRPIEPRKTKVATTRIGLNI